MSKITTVYDTILTALTAIFPEKTRLNDPYTLSDNPEHLLRDGYGLRKGSTEQGISELCSLSEIHGFEVSLCREIVRTESQDVPLDDEVKGLLEDAFELRERVYRYDELGIDTDITNVTLGSVSEVSSFVANKGKFITVSVAFNVQVTENIN
jgi:hypothetical protein